MSADLLRQAATILRERAEAATPGPWERGDNWHIQGATHCQCRPEWGPAIKRRMDINGTVMAAHIHRADGQWPHGIYTAELQREGYPHCVVYDDRGDMDEDAAYIATVHPGVGLALAAWLDDIAAGWVWDECPDDVQTPDGWPLTLDESMDRHAVTIARLIVGGAS